MSTTGRRRCAPRAMSSLSRKICFFAIVYPRIALGQQILSLFAQYIAKTHGRPFALLHDNGDDNDC